MAGNNIPPDILNNLEKFYESRLRIIANNIRAVREGHSPEWLSLHTGIDRRQINRIEAMDANPTIHTITLINIEEGQDFLYQILEFFINLL